MRNRSFIYFSSNDEEFQSGLLAPHPKGTFLISSFKGEAHSFRFTPCKVSDIDFSQDGLLITELRDTEMNQHCNLVKKAIANITNGQLKKVVLSRTKNVSGKFCIQNVLSQLKEQFPLAFVYCLRLENEMWIGATPEILISGNHKKFQSHSLAGTKPKNESFSRKEIEEQDIVTTYITEKLKGTKNLEVKKTSELVYGEIKHLLSVITFETESVASCLSKLHPTPAVLGVPSQEAKDFILHNEQHPRHLYTGYLGFSDDDRTDIFVNLRCGRVHKAGVDLFAGGGIVQNSDPQDEWKETENKLATFTAILNNNKLEGI